MICSICGNPTTNTYEAFPDGTLLMFGKPNTLCYPCQLLWEVAKVLIPETDQERAEAHAAYQKLIDLKIKAIQGRKT